MKTRPIDENIQNDLRLIVGACGRLYNYGVNLNIKKKRTYGSWKAHKVFMLGMLKRERNAKKMKIKKESRQ